MGNLQADRLETMNGFEKAFAATMQHEGGQLVNDRLDPGGMTYFGISRCYWPSWYGWQMIDNALANNTPLSLVDGLADSVSNFYRVNFWDRFQGEKVSGLSQKVASEIFDFAVNCGLTNAVKSIQENLNLLNRNQVIYNDVVVDGLCGPATIHALESLLCDIRKSREQQESVLATMINSDQIQHYKALMRSHPEKERFAGWLYRTA